MRTTKIMRNSLLPWKPQYLSGDEVICYAERYYGYSLERALRKNISRKMTQGGGVPTVRCARLLVVPAERREDGGRVERRHCWVNCGWGYTLCPNDPRSYGLPKPSPTILWHEPSKSYQHIHWVLNQSWPHFGH